MQGRMPFSIAATIWSFPFSGILGHLLENIQHYVFLLGNQTQPEVMAQVLEWIHALSLTAGRPAGMTRPWLNQPPQVTPGLD